MERNRRDTECPRDGRKTERPQHLLSSTSLSYRLKHSHGFAPATVPPLGTTSSDLGDLDAREDRY